MLTIISFLGFTLFVAFVAWYATRKTDEKSADGYYLGGRSLGAITIAGSLLLTNLSAEQIVGLNGQAFAEGLMVMAWETLAAIAMIFTAIYLLPKYMKKGITTIPEFVEKRFDQQTKALLSILFLFAYGIVLLPTILYSGSLAFSTMFDLPNIMGVTPWTVIWICVITIGLIGMVYAIFGGLKAVAVSDLINAIGLLIGGLLIPIFGLLLIGDGDLGSGLGILWDTNPEKFKMKGAVDSSIPFGTIFTGMMLAQIYYWGTNQSILQRVFGAKSLKEGQKGMLLAAFVKFVIPIIVVLPGIIAWHVFEGQLDNPDQAYPALVAKVLPGAFTGFFAAVLFGAVLSSFNSLLNSSATLFGFDLYRMYFKKDATEVETVKAGKTFGIGLAVVSMLIAPFIAFAPDGLFSYIQQSLGSLSVPILAVVMTGVLTKKVPAIGAKVVMVGGVLLYLISLLLLEPHFRETAVSMAQSQGITDLNELSIIKAKAYPHYLHVMGILFVFNIIVMLVFGWLKPKKSITEEETTDVIDITPWKYAFVVGAVIALLVISTYFIFS
ncbi:MULTISPECIES: solute:sodium symporter family transporter [Croceitalea]|uniref:Solute:sodium symporter family transporter n=1 Tax=Croceitalea vernalis TaxID=3075599 RepID=A0ABU3BDE4_9FLAO|nr:MULTISPECIES: solute:sodium symporter family transporter [unclassified Croceitalea]MDT0538377.1 solute:sodium symporter family transporter [Croceitalea sp. P059]MDT0620160.1 solute:sodium symporter family transporter [Croceitalea sp. P007]